MHLQKKVVKNASFLNIIESDTQGVRLKTKVVRNTSFLKLLSNPRDAFPRRRSSKTNTPFLNMVNTLTKWLSIKGKSQRFARYEWKAKWRFKKEQQRWLTYKHDPSLEVSVYESMGHNPSTRSKHDPSQKIIVYESMGHTHWIHLTEEGRQECSSSEYYQVRHPCVAPYRRRLCKNAPLLNIIKLDTFVVHLTEEGRQECSSSEYYQVRHPRGAPSRRRSSRMNPLFWNY